MSGETVLIDYGAGNLNSAEKAFRHVGEQHGYAIRVSADPRDIERASHIVLPGVGAYADCMRGLMAIAGMRDALQDAVQVRKTPFLGICVGMQLMAEFGLEHGKTAGLGWIDGTVEAIRPRDPALKIPHMGWNELEIKDASHPVLAGIHSGDHAYFVHSYAMTCHNPDDVLATVDYGGPVTAIVAREHCIGAQFHPEKSQKTGLKLIENFLKL